MDRRFSKNIGFNYFILGGVKHSEKKVTVEEVRFSLMCVFIPIDRLYLTSGLSVLDTRFFGCQSVSESADTFFSYLEHFFCSV